MLNKKRVLIGLFIFFAVFVVISWNEAQLKSEYMGAVLKTLEKLHEIAISRGEDSEKRNQINNAVKALSEPKQLSTLGRLCHGIQGNIGGENLKYETFFSWAGMDCVNLLGESNSENASQELKLLKDYCQPEGGEAILFLEAEKKQQEKTPERR